MKKILFSLFFLLLLFLLPKIASLPLFHPFFSQKIKGKTGLNVTIEKTHFSWLGPQEFQNLSFEKNAVTGKIKNLSLKAFFWSFSGPISFDGGSFTYARETFSDIAGSWENETFRLSDKENKLSAKGKIFSPKHYEISFRFQNFPLALIDDSLAKNWGPSANIQAEIKTEKAGLQIQSDIKSKRFSLKPQGVFSDEKFRIKSPLALTIHSLPPSYKGFLQKPFSIEISPEGFSFPFPYKTNLVSIEKALTSSIEFEMLEKKDLDWIKALFKKTSLRPGNVRLAPFSFSMHQSIVRLEKIEAWVSGDIHLFFWGEIDLQKNRLRMKLGIPKDTLSKFFAITKVSDDFLLTLSIKGSPDHPKIDRKEALAKIASLLAIERLKQK